MIRNICIIVIQCSINYILATYSYSNNYVAIANYVGIARYIDYRLSVQVKESKVVVHQLVCIGDHTMAGMMMSHDMMIELLLMLHH